MKFGFIAKHRGIWPAAWVCEALGVSRGGFHAWMTRPPSMRARTNEALAGQVRSFFLQSDRTYGARRVWKDVLAEGVSCGLHRIERLMREQALRARPKRRRLPSDTGERLTQSISPNLIDRQFEAPAPNRKWVADFTYIWTAEGWLYVAAVLDLFSRRVAGWSMSATMTAQLVTDALMMAIWRRGSRQAPGMGRPDFLRTALHAHAKYSASSDGGDLSDQLAIVVTSQMQMPGKRTSSTSFTRSAMTKGNTPL